MAKLRLIVEIEATDGRDNTKLAGVISDYAEEQFEQYTIEHGRPMSLRSWIIKPNKDGAFGK